jgi:hypothetical protein
MSAYEPMPDPEETSPTRGPGPTTSQAIGLFIFVFADVAGLLLPIIAVVMLVFGQSVGDCLVFAVSGLALSTWTKRR